jgi:hypothetical protein
MRRSAQPPAFHGISTRAFEHLEPRMMLHANPLSWAGDGNLSLSFAPDGTSIGGLHSTLLESFNAIAPEAQWKEAILRAFQTWAVETNATVGVVPDNGADFGVAGLSRSDPRFGDIRIGAAPLDSGVFAIAVSASDVLSGTWVGDVIFNSNAQFANLDEVFAVALHEAGHVFGIGHSENPLSPMHVHGITPVTALTPADIGAIRSLYGVPQSDANERANSNDTMAGATQLKLNSISAGGPGSAP